MNAPLCLLPSPCPVASAALKHPKGPQDAAKAEICFASSSLRICFMIKLLQVATPNLQVRFRGSCDIILPCML